MAPSLPSHHPGFPEGAACPYVEGVPYPEKKGCKYVKLDLRATVPAAALPP